MIASSLLQALDLGALKFPSNPSEGVATLKIKGKYKIDEKKPHGKDDPTLTGVGKEAREVTVEMWWTTRIADETRSFIQQISPVGINAGKAWELSHPDCEIYRFNAIMFTSIGEIDRSTTGKESISFTALSWTKTPPVQKGTGAKTATDAEQWKNAPSTGGNTIYITPSGQKIDMGPGPVTYTTPSGQVYGFDQAENAPSASVPK
jgi:hypothetical protein